MDNFSHCTVILYLNHKGSILKEVKEHIIFTAEMDTPSYKAWWKSGLLRWNVTMRLRNLSGKASHHYYSGDHYQGSCSIIVERVQSFILSRGITSLGPKAPWTYLIRNGFSTNLSGENDSLASSGNLWPQMKPWSITSNQRWSELWKDSLPYKKAKTVMSAGKVTVYIS